MHADYFGGTLFSKEKAREFIMLMDQALLEYGGHTDECEFMRNRSDYEPACMCGWTKLKKQLKGG